MTIICKSTSDKIKTAYCKVEFPLPYNVQKRLDQKLDTIPENDAVRHHKDVFSRTTKIALTGDCLVIYQSTKRLAQPLASVFLKKYNLRSDSSSITLAAIANPSHQIKLFVKPEQKQEWKNTLFYITSSPTPVLFNPSIRIQRKKFKLPLGNISEDSQNTTCASTPSVTSFKRRNCLKIRRRP